MSVIRIKICCISSVEEMRTAVKFGASAIGLVGRMPSGPGVIDDDLIERIATAAPPPVATFLLTSETQASAVIAHHKKVHTNTLQIVDRLTEGSYRDIRSALPGVKLVQVIHVRDEQSADEALACAGEVDALLLDSGNPGLSVKELGGTGRVHNWAISRRIVESSPVPVFLAGGLNPDNIRKAIETVHPYGVDVCSGVRTDGKLDPVKLERFIKAAGEM